ncbi:MAG: class I SAM-dependent methyltransferase, partial [Candidatus Neomarinimicrobiota bacterium]|nr:class I SAM-dependent methyltransferase [Candidatus Neomarinimicrobiota bacterium]
ELNKIFSTKDYLISGEKFDIVECLTCTLRITSPFPSADTIGDYYNSKDYISHSDESKGLFDLIYKFVRLHMLDKKRKLIEKSSGNRNGKLLDIGCGAGHFLNAMKKTGWNVQGVDVSEKARELVSNSFNLDVKSPLDWLNSDEKYDVITCWHSLEHIHEPWIYLDKIRTHLNPDGVLVVALPNYNSTDAKRYGSSWAAYDTPRHLYHFTIESMEKIASLCDFSIQSMHRMNFDSFYVSILSAKHMGKSFFSGVLNGFNSWLSAMFNRKKCSSLIYIMK